MQHVLLIMQTVNQLVFLVKASKGDSEQDKFEAALTNSGFTVQLLNSISFEFKNLDVLLKYLDTPEQFSGFVFSSPRCVEATKLALNGKPLNDLWKDKHNYVVGKSTAQDALNGLGLNCLGEESGNADNLADVMLKESATFSKPFLYPHSNLKMDILKRKFQDRLRLCEVCVYDTVSNPGVCDDFDDKTERFTRLPEYLVLFSPSGVKSILKCLRRLPENSTKLVAIGPTTADAIRELGFEVHGTAAQPDPENVISVIRNS